MASSKKLTRRTKIRKSIRKRISGTAERPRLAIYRSNKEIYCQVIDDVEGKTIAGASSRSKAVSDAAGDQNKSGVSKLVGLEIARIAKEKGIDAVVFDRGGYKFHGRVKALAEGAREGGLKF